MIGGGMAMHKARIFAENTKDPQSRMFTVSELRTYERLAKLAEGELCCKTRP